MVFREQIVIWGLFFVCFDWLAGLVWVSHLAMPGLTPDCTQESHLAMLKGLYGMPRIKSRSTKRARQVLSFL